MKSRCVALSDVAGDLAWRMDRVLWLAAALASSMTFSANGQMIIAHRGGVVDEQHSENSFKALEEAIGRGYTHVEIDARITGDGHVVCFHDDELDKEAGIEGKISELPRDSVTRIILARSHETYRPLKRIALVPLVALTSW